MSETIIVVEDDADIAATIREALLMAGYDVPASVPSGREALETAARTHPALVIMDVQLDGALDGIETAQRLRDRDGTRVIYVTAATDDDMLRRAKQTAPLGYLKKPFNPRELLIAVEIALHLAALESALEARERWFAKTLQSIDDAVVTTDADDRVTFLNPAAATMIGVEERASIGKKIDEVVRFVTARGEQLPALTRSTPVGLIRLEALPREARLGTNRPGAGAPIQVEIEGSVSPIALDDGPHCAHRYGTVMVFRDVGERRRLERRLGMAERLAAIGTMAAGVQHEINNPLATVVANVQFTLEALRGCKEVGPSREEIAELVAALEEASEAAERVRRSVADLRHFSRSAEGAEVPLDLPTTLDEAVRATAHLVRHHATVRRSYGTTPRVLAEEGQLSRVFTNLLLNAAQATGDGGAAQHTIVITTRTDPMGRAIVEVTDSGPGLPEDVLHRVFDPFFTTVPENADLGLGLAICHSIVVSLGGEIEVESDLGRGTTFRVALLPAQAVAPPSPHRARPLPPPARPRSPLERGRVLVVDDEVAIGKAIRRILSREHDVTLESDARVALDRLSRESFDVVFCDLMMPSMSGMAFFDELALRSPDQAARIVFLTGGAFSPRSVEFLRDSRNICLPKPFSREAVSAVVRSFTAGA